MTAPHVSVLTPVYNGAPFIRACIESILSQTHRNLSITVVDNCSTDGTPELVDRYAKIDSRVSLVRYENFVSANANHNRAFGLIDHATDYVKVVQADDLLFAECIEAMLRPALIEPSVGVVSGYRLRGTEVDLVGLPFPQEVTTGTFILRQSLLGGPYVTGSPTSTLIRSDLVLRRRPFYEEDFEHCDTEAIYWAFTQSNFALVHQVVTFSRRQQFSEIRKAEKIKSNWPEGIRMLLRYGPDVLSLEEFRARLRYELGVYLWFHAKQRVKPSRWRDKEFRRFHSRISRVLEVESKGNREVEFAMRAVRGLLGPRSASPSARRSMAYGPERNT